MKCSCKCDCSLISIREHLKLSSSTIFLGFPEISSSTLPERTPTDVSQKLPKKETATLKKFLTNLNKPSTCCCQIFYTGLSHKSTKNELLRNRCLAICNLNKTHSVAYVPWDFEKTKISILLTLTSTNISVTIKDH